MFLGLDKPIILCYSVTVKKNTKTTQTRYCLLSDVWYDRHDGKDNVIYHIGTITTLDWRPEEIHGALVAGLLEEVIDDNST